MTELMDRKLLDAMLNSEKRGDYRTLRSHVLYKGAIVADSKDNDVVRDFAHLMVRASRAWRIEMRDGEGSLLDPLNAQNIRWGLVPCPPVVP
ncbi:hypothetical protein GGE35_002960 [Rhizobium cellulosilyticum]|uniref:Uncharacterized protein n=1 Tax=Aliirhizobium cellulosilyticum TaxID=393664 RepID=A0A7W6SAC0_9HYPH|nr:hypothetical protein [Rhizobium cellulosilyticum]MBB4412506.1 hypothetical protein [Rhizobium cellulosilyticum]MBB4447138.1 hypothetical protein [Rhizobium cellulosilyticum]